MISIAFLKSALILMTVYGFNELKELVAKGFSPEIVIDVGANHGKW